MICRYAILLLSRVLRAIDNLMTVLSKGAISAMLHRFKFVDLH